MTKVLVYTQVYNTRKYLEKCIKSVLAQTVEDLLYVILDNGCTDGSQDIIRKYAELDSRIIVEKREENDPLSAVAEIALKYEGYEYYAVLDSDDYMEPYFLETLIERCEYYHADMCIGGVGCIDADDRSQGILRVPQKEICIPQSEYVARMEEIYEFIRTNWGRVIRRKAITKMDLYWLNKIWDTRYAIDTEITFAMFERCNSIVLTDKVVMQYRRHVSSYSYAFNQKRFEGNIIQFHRLAKFIMSSEENRLRNLIFVYAVFDGELMGTLSILFHSNASLPDMLLEAAEILSHAVTQQLLELKLSVNITELILKFLYMIKEHTNTTVLTQMALNLLKLMHITVTEEANLNYSAYIDKLAKEYNVS